ncbi:MAG TPA: PPK2 family polyphosphate kinase [Chitinophagaceae bacterium]|nr:PPK2 family polyphosphate kinase [Chitinophagaceae bacterium]
MSRIKLSEVDTRAPKQFDKEATKREIEKLLEKLDELQNLLYAESKHSLLVVIQGMDASGKDGAIRNVFGKLNPQGVQVKSFKVPTAEEAAHDFLWRVHQHAPAKGMIQVFNRSHYEDIVITRVHKYIDDRTAKKRMEAINNFEKLLHDHNNTSILKFYLHVSPQEQLERLTERIQNPQKQWKYNENDFVEAKLWDIYMDMYEDCFEHCSDVPWTIVPADQNWYKEYIIATKIFETLKGFNMKYPGLKK